MASSEQNKKMAAEMKSRKINRNTQKCPICYRTITRDNGAGSRYNHKCPV